MCIFSVHNTCKRMTSLLSPSYHMEGVSWVCLWGRWSSSLRLLINRQQYHICLDLCLLHCPLCHHVPWMWKGRRAKEMDERKVVGSVWELVPMPPWGTGLQHVDENQSSVLWCSGGLRVPTDTMHGPSADVKQWHGRWRWWVMWGLWWCHTHRAHRWDMWGFCPLRYPRLPQGLTPTFVLNQNKWKFCFALFWLQSKGGKKFLQQNKLKWRTFKPWRLPDCFALLQCEGLLVV